MKRSLMMAAAVAAYVLPAAAPVMAQDAPLFRSRADIRAAAAAEARASAPAAAPAAQPQQNREQRQERREERQERRAERQEQAAPSGDAPLFRNRQDIRDAAAAEQRQDRRQDRREDRREDRQEAREERRQADPNEPLFRNRQDIRDAAAAEQRRLRRENGGDSREERREDRREDRQDRRQDRREDRREYREFRQRFSADQWRRDWNRQHSSDWWRSDRRFRGYSGLRMGFYFAPGYGYYQVPRSYWGRRYYEGDYLPSIFWRYQLNDWRTFGLGYPPAGTRWVLVDNHIYLIDEYDGYIVDVIYDAWRW